MLALLCGGQGRLSPALFDLTADQPEAAAIFAQAGALLGQDPRSLVRSADEDQLTVNRTSQILTVTATLALHACLAEHMPERIAVTGYSVGEMAAWAIAGVWPAADALSLTGQRAQAMDQAAHDGGSGECGGLGYIRGLDRATLEKLAEQQECAIAIINPQSLFVVGGAVTALMDLCHDALAAGASHAGRLAVRIAAHTPALAAAVPPFQAALATTTLAPLARNRLLLAGSDGTRIFSVPKALGLLASQVTRTIDWNRTLEALVEEGVDRVLDLGPGHALAEMMRGAHPEIDSYAADSFRSIEGIRRWLAVRHPL